MAHSVWDGHLRLSLVTCPVALYKATAPKGGISFHLINPKTKSRIVQVTKDPTTGKELEYKDLVRGFEVSKNRYVLIDPEELKALRIESTHVFDLERFVDAATIDRIYWDEPYYLAPSEKIHGAHGAGPAAEESALEGLCQVREAAAPGDRATPEDMRRR